MEKGNSGQGKNDLGNFAEEKFSKEILAKENGSSSALGHRMPCPNKLTWFRVNLSYW